jgi:hypothetical protein
MTGQLRSTLQTRADDLEPWEVDVDAVIGAGNRRLRRRRVALAGGTAIALAVAAGATTLGIRHHDTSPAPANDTAIPLAYAVGSVIHTGDTTVDVGVKVESMVALKDGYLYSGPDGTVYHWGDGAAQKLGHVADRSTRLYVSDDGIAAVWSDGHYIEGWPLGPIGNTRFWGGFDPHDGEVNVVEALSDGHLWFWDGNATEVAETRPLGDAGWKDKGLGQASVVDAAGDRILVDVGGGMAVARANLLTPDNLATFQPGTDLTGVTPQVTGVSTGDLAPDGQHWFTSDDGRFAVYDSTTGDGQEPTHDGFVGVTPYQWLGNDTIAAIGSPSSAPDGPVSLLTCRVSTNDCTVAVADAGTGDDVVLANGQPTG